MKKHGGDIEVIYKGPSNGIKPEIISVSATNTSNKEAKIKVEAKTEDEAGIEKIIIMRNGIKVNEKVTNGSNITEEIEVKGNGKYTVVVVGKNLMRIESEEIEVTGLVTLSGLLSVGTVIDASVQLTITGESVDSNIEKVEIYEGTSKIGEMPIEEQTKNINKTYKIENLPFYNKKSYTAKIITQVDNINTNQVTCENQRALATKADFNTLASMVNGGNDFRRSNLKTYKRHR